MRRVLSWWGERLPVPWESLKLHLQESMPVHLKHWMLFLGGTPLILFVILVVSGIMLTFYYVPSTAEAYNSVQHITFEVRYGWLIRGIHATSANLMVFTILLHMIRVYVTRAYRRPRELNWSIGVLLLITTLGLTFTGYSLVYDQLSYWATTVGTSFIAAIPLIGEPLLWLLRGGPDVNPNTLTRFYNLHVGLLPTLMVVLIACHVALIRLHDIAPLENDDRKETFSLMPDHLLKEAMIALALLIGIIAWVAIYPPVLTGAADPTTTPESIRPEWYFYPTFRWLKMVPIKVGLWTSLLVVFGMIAWPFLERPLDAFGEKVLHIKRFGYALGILTFLFILTLLVVETISH